MNNEVSLCMIVKNEEKALPQCLNSINKLVNEIIIIDTGSEDKTVEIAKSFGAKVYFFQWNDNFSEARNESLKYATKDWILILDVDDELFEEDQINFKRLINSNLDKNLIYFFETHSYYGTTKDENSVTINLNPRFFKNNEGTHYEGKIHNQLIYSKEKDSLIINSIKVHHSGYLNDNIKIKNKRQRNISMLMDQIKDDPENYFAYFNLGNEFAALSDEKSALNYYYKSFEGFDNLNGYSFLLILKIVIINYNLKNYEDAFKYIDIGLNYYPNFTDLYFMKALIFKDINMPTLQIKALETCIDMGEPPSTLKCFPGVGTFKAYFELGNVYLNLNDYDMSLSYYLKSLNSKTNFINPLYGIARILKLKKLLVDNFKKNIEVLVTSYPSPKLILIDLFYNEGYYQVALDYILEYEKEYELTEKLLLLKAKALIISKDFASVITLDSNNKKFSSNVHLKFYKIISLILMDALEAAKNLINTLELESLDNISVKVFNVYLQFINLLTETSVMQISEIENESDYMSIIIEILDILLFTDELDKLKIAVNLLNLINNKFALLELGKLYYKHGYMEVAKNELLRSIKEFGIYDTESLDILKLI
ncbi:glycosyltransferase involved in cell wall biosynthesis [Clostridium punense]|uniref:Glycosyltransferase involved in cell wall biosynthesis n=1 Tax=Clostridium punense TaxID=1054297 RepID=A0ABS4K9I7_9CLOT|nr:glycosyltransferase [Clostridium punense]MBP2024015.1 glycosyltransferase involved in cell wall biosynthesis [Clostridium punense]